MQSVIRHSHALTHTGKVRDSNQDAYVCHDEIGLWAVADGMGGHDAGDVASQMIAEHLNGIESAPSLAELKSAVSAAIEQANTRLIGMADQFTPGRAAGSTVAALLVRDDQGFAMWAGDSRVYRLRDGVLEQVTRDHSHVQTLIDEDMVAPEDAEMHPLAHIITRAVGFDEPLALQSTRLEVRPGDRYLLCSDGLTRVVAHAELEKTMAQDDLGEAVRALLDATLAGGAPDNVTILAVDQEA